MSNDKRIFLSPPYLGGNERRYVEDAFDSNYIAPCGPMVDRFERDFAAYTGIPNACALSSATAALDLIFDKLGVGRGDLIFCSDMTFVASIAPAVHRGAEPIFIDADALSWTMDPALLAEALNDAKRTGKLPRAVVAVDLYGQCCNYAKIGALCEEYGIPLVVDAAEALGSRYLDATGEWKSAGDAGMASVFSFNGNKIITTSGGGMLASHDEQFVADARFLSQQAKDPFPWYEHTRLGYNYRMSNVTAAIGVGQLECLDGKVRRRREIFAQYVNALSGAGVLEFMREANYCRMNRWLTVATINEDAHTAPEDVRLALEAKNIESRRIWKAMHMQPVFSDAKVYGGGVSERCFSRGICLPSGDGMSDSDVERVCSAICAIM